MQRREKAKMRKLPYYAPELMVKYAKFMKEYYRKNPSSTEEEMMETLKRHFELDCSISKIKMTITKLIRKYHRTRYLMDNPKPNVKHKDKKWISKCCPFFMDLEQALQSSEHFSRKILKPSVLPKKLSGNVSETSARTESTEDEWQTADVKPSNDRRSSPEKIPQSPRQKPTATIITTIHQEPQDHQINNPNCTVISKKDAKNDSNNLHRQVVCDCKPTIKNEDHLNLDTAIAKSETRIYKQTLNSGQQLELRKLEDRKEERQFQIELTKLNQDYEIMKLRLQIKLERTKNLNKRLGTKV